MSIYNPDLNDPFIIDLMEWMKNNPISKQDLDGLVFDFIPGPKHCDEVKQQISDSNKQYYLTHEGQERRKRLSIKNSHIKSDELKRRWIENYDLMKSMRQGMGRTKGAKDLKPRQKRNNIRQITDGHTIFKDAYAAAEIYGIDPVNIRRKCRKKIDKWRYI